jgi:hypothetical protein
LNVSDADKMFLILICGLEEENVKHVLRGYPSARMFGEYVIKSFRKAIARVQISYKYWRRCEAKECEFLVVVAKKI